MMDPVDFVVIMIALKTCNLQALNDKQLLKVPTAVFVAGGIYHEQGVVADYPSSGAAKWLAEVKRRGLGTELDAIIVERGG